MLYALIHKERRKIGIYNSDHISSELIEELSLDDASKLSNTLIACIDKLNERLIRPTKMKEEKSNE